jgi:hypothetical protein
MTSVNPKVLRSNRFARTGIVACLGFAALWVCLAWAHAFKGNLGGAILFTLASLVLIPVATSVALVATFKIFTSRVGSVDGIKRVDRFFLVMGAVLGAVGVAVCARIIFGIMTEG